MYVVQGVMKIGTGGRGGDGASVAATQLRSAPAQLRGLSRNCDFGSGAEPFATTRERLRAAPSGEPLLGYDQIRQL